MTTVPADAMSRMIRKQYVAPIQLPYIKDPISFWSPFHHVAGVAVPAFRIGVEMASQIFRARTAPARGYR
jgi:hypothetical protein